MSWVRLDDHFDEHPKILRAGALGAALWTKTLAYCNRQPARNGFIPLEKVKSYRDADLRDPTKIAARLVAAGLWEEAEGGYRIHDYHDFQPTVEDAERLSTKRATAGRRGGVRSGEARRVEANPKQPASNLLHPPKQVASTHRSKREAKANPGPVPVPTTAESYDSAPLFSPPNDSSSSEKAETRGGGSTRARASQAALHASFERFKVAYPRREKWPAAEKEWFKLAPDDDLVDTILAAIALQKRGTNWLEADGKYIPHPATWLHQRRWEDEVRESTLGANGQPLNGSMAAVRRVGERRLAVRGESIG
jgi:hypothetical protein